MSFRLPSVRTSRSFDAYISGVVRTFSSPLPSSSTADPASHYGPLLYNSTAFTGYASAMSKPSVVIPGLTLAQSNGATKSKAPTKPMPPRSKYADSQSPCHNDEANACRTPSRNAGDAQPLRKTSPQIPSTSSGGIPNPTPQYIAQAYLNPQRLAEPRRILIIIDLNGTLLYRPNKRRPFHFVQRPHAKSFLSYCLDTFYVAIWSSARPENVSKMVAQLLDPAQRDRCLLIWGRDQFGLSPSDYISKVQVYKRLTSVWTNPRVMQSHPTSHIGGRWNQSNTVLLDDSSEKARSEPFNLLQLPEFSGLDTEIPHVLPQVHDYLNSLSYQADISRFMRQSPFNLNPCYALRSASAQAQVSEQVVQSAEQSL